MIPSEAPANAIPPPADFLRLHTLTQRADFVKASRGAYHARPGFVLQMRKRNVEETPDADIVRVGFTCSKKVGNAVARNRAKRRLREIARLVLLTDAKPGHDYVLIGRRDTTASTPFTQLHSDFVRAVAKLHARGT